MINSGGIGTFLKGILAHLTHLPITLLTPKAPIFSFREQFELSLTIPKCSVFWTPHFNIPLGPIRAKRKLVTVHDVCHFAFYGGLKGIAHLGLKAYFNRIAYGGWKVATVSHFSKKEIIKYTPIKEPNVIHCGVDHSQFSFGRRSPTKPFFLFVGGTKKHKNLDGMVEAFSRFKGKEKLMIVNHHHTQEELISLYREATAVIVPSHYEGFGLIALEAMAVGCPVIAARKASLPEVVGDAAHFIEGDLVDALDLLSRDESYRHQLSEKGRARAKLFCWKRAAEQYEALLT